MHHLSLWHVIVALLLIAYFFAIAGFFAYLLYGPGVDIKLPNYLIASDATTTPVVSTTASSTATEMATSSEPIVVMVPPPPPVIDLLTGHAGALFRCDANKTFKADLREGSVRLMLSDGRGISVPQTTSFEGGATYANTNASFVFEVKGFDAFIEENKIQTYRNCVMAP